MTRALLFNLIGNLPVGLRLEFRFLLLELERCLSSASALSLPTAREASLPLRGTALPAPPAFHGKLFSKP